MSEKGFISLYRKFLEWEWYTDETVMRLFIHCLLKANYKDNKWQGKVVARGSFITSREALSTELKISVQKIRTALNKLKSTNDITIKTTNTYTQIYVVNYNKYQHDAKEINEQVNQEISQQLTIKQPSNNHQITTTNKDNKENNINKVNKKERVKKKNAHGEFKKVKLTNDELNKLKEEFPKHYEIIIKYLDEYKEMKGTTYKNDYIAIKKWVIKACIERGLIDEFDIEPKKPSKPKIQVQQEEMSEEELKELKKRLPNLYK